MADETPEEATQQFREADRCYRGRDYTGALAILDELDTRYPGDKNLMFARARTLGKVGREDEALALCDRLVSDFGYARAARLQVKLLKSITEQIDNDAAAPKPPPIPIPDADSDAEDGPKERRFRIKPIRLLILIVLIVLTVMRFVHPAISIGIVAGYFAVKWLLGKAILRLVSMPFKMKAKALEGATVEVHAVTPVSNPDPELLDDMEDDGRELRFVQIDVTIQPQPRDEGFAHWEPGELSLAPESAEIKGLDDLDGCFNVTDIKIVTDGVDEDDEGYKLSGPARIKVLVGLPPGEQGYQFVYYTECFGNVQVPE